MNEEKEIWKIYKKTRKDVWEVSNFGRVKCNGEIYECKPNNRGYLTFGGYFVHRAVAELFIPNPYNKPEVDHIDTNPLNNHYKNLRWVTHRENMLNPITRKQISETMKGKNLPEETRMKVSEAMKGKVFSEEHKKNLSKALKGNKNAYGKHLSEESKIKMSAAKKGHTWFIGTDGKRHWV